MLQYTQHYICSSHQSSIHNLSDCSIEKLFDLSKDPFETTNIASSNADIIKIIREKLDKIYQSNPYNRYINQLNISQEEIKSSNNEKNPKISTIAGFKVDKDATSKHLNQQGKWLLTNYRPNLWLQFHMPSIWRSTFVKGDCSMNPKLSPSQCIFTHPWISDVSFTK